ncbi:long-chain-fatty-acid--CoA ligase 4-like [Oppia nitens]|uniref:long-chain-fatty-acid--CoA ligase 4-like n=1 Tax=Oppia nitens TaxID=1686743 RepID=UPI0023D9F33D|nr:long-chain-fatty-acid--CoA ligase 4-like [Oppia nitens]
MYTSGTTGQPKAVCISHHQLYSSARSLLSVTTNDMTNDVDRHIHISYLPLAHMLGFSLDSFCFFCGVKIGYSSPFTLTDTSPNLASGQQGDLKLLKPTSMPAVPLVLDRLLKDINEKIRSASPIAGPLFAYLMQYKIRWTQRGYRTPIINRLLTNRISEAMGGQLEQFMIGGAPLNPHINALMRAALNLKRLSIGYGATETTSGAIGTYGNDFQYESVGCPVYGIDIKLVDWPEGGYLTTDRPRARSEILIGGDIVSNGYFKEPELTAQVFQVDSDGQRWFQTGDIAEVSDDGMFKIIDRKKDLSKLSNGEYVSLGKIEGTLKSCDFVDNICIVVNSEYSNCVALVTPNRRAIHKLAKQLGLINNSDSNNNWEQLCIDSQIVDTVLQGLADTGQQNGLTRLEIPVRCRLCPEEWSPDNGMITAAMKLKRNVVMDYYKPDINAMFDTIQ